jgi:hypothetical protein
MYRTWCSCSTAASPLNGLVFALRVHVHNPRQRQPLQFTSIFTPKWLSADVTSQLPSAETKLQAGTCTDFHANLQNSHYAQDTLDGCIFAKHGKCMLPTGRLQVPHFGRPHRAGPADSAGQHRSAAHTDTAGTCCSSQKTLSDCCTLLQFAASPCAPPAPGERKQLWDTTTQNMSV